LTDIYLLTHQDISINWVKANIYYISVQQQTPSYYNEPYPPSNYYGGPPANQGPPNPVYPPPPPSQQRFWASCFEYKHVQDIWFKILFRELTF